MLTPIQGAFGRLYAHPGFRRYFANTSWMFAEQFLRMAAGLLVGVWVARYLGPQQFGVFSYALAFVSIFAGIAKLGLDSILVRNLVNAPDQRDVYLGTAFWLKLGGAMLTLGIVVITSLFSANDRTTSLYIFIIACGILFQASEVIDFYFQAKVLSRFVSLCKMTQLLISSLLKLYFVLTGAALICFVVVSLVDQITLALTLHLAYRQQKIGSFHRRFDWRVARKLLEDGWPLIFSSVLVMIYLRIDQIMIKRLLGEREVGLFSAAVRLSEVWYMLPVIITSSLFPAIIGAKLAGESLYRFRLQRLYTLMMWLALGIALPMTFLGEWLVTRIYGVAYREAGAVLVIHTWTSVFVFLGVVTGSWLISEGLQRHILYRTLACAVINILLNLALIPRYGIRGSAVATVISQALAAFAFDLVARNTRIACVMKLKSLNFSYLLDWNH